MFPLYLMAYHVCVKFARLTHEYSLKIYLYVSFSLMTPNIFNSYVSLFSFRNIITYLCIFFEAFITKAIKKYYLWRWLFTNVWIKKIKENFPYILVKNESSVICGMKREIWRDGRGKIIDFFYARVKNQYIVVSLFIIFFRTVIVLHKQNIIFYCVLFFQLLFPLVDKLLYYDYEYLWIVSYGSDLKIFFSLFFEQILAFFCAEYFHFNLSDCPNPGKYHELISCLLESKTHYHLVFSPI